MIGKLVGSLFSLAILAIVIVTVIDFYQVTNDKDPMFCLSNETIEYDDGTVKTCKGIVYNVYDYDRVEANLIGTEFVPFWQEPRTSF